MKLNLYITDEADKLGLFSIGTLDGEDAQENLRLAALDLFRDKLKLGVELPSFSSLETIEGFRYLNGANLHLVRDQFLGVIIESKDRNALLEIMKLLE